MYVFFFFFFPLCQAKEGFTNLLGVDYSEAAIKLAQAVATSEELNIKFEVTIMKYCHHSYTVPIHPFIYFLSKFQTCDILSNEEQPLHGKKFKIVIDKGTYDAISLNPENTTDKRTSYINAVNSILDEDGIFVLTSCNWTQSELENHFKTCECWLLEILHVMANISLFTMSAMFQIFSYTEFYQLLNFSLVAKLETQLLLWFLKEIMYFVRSLMRP